MTRQGRFLALLFLLCALPTGLGCALLTPMSELPDEPSHIARADGLLLGQILGHKAPPAPLGGVMVHKAVLQAALAELWPSFPAKPLLAPARQAARVLGWGGGTVFCQTNMVQYFPAFYVPGSLGIGLGRALGLGPLYALYAGRLAMLASFLAMGSAALLLARRGRALLFALLCLPMTLALAASFNLDGQLIGATILAAALLTRGGQGRAWWLALALLSLVACAKPPYSLLLGAALLPFGTPGRGQRNRGTALALLPPCLWLALTLHGNFAPWPRPPYHPGPLWPGAPGLTLTATSDAGNLAVLLAHPAQIWRLPVAFVVSDWPYLWPAMLGVFGWGPVLMQGWQYAGWMVALAAACLGLLAEPRGRWRAGEAMFVLGLVYASFLAMALALYVTWTNVGQARIDGINGRYFLLFPPFLLFVLPGLGGRLGARRAQFCALACCLPALCMALADIYGLPLLLLRTYHMAAP